MNDIWDSDRPAMLLSGLELLGTALPTVRRGGIDPEAVATALDRAAYTIDELNERCSRHLAEQADLAAQLDVMLVAAQRNAEDASEAAQITVDARSAEAAATAVVSDALRETQRIADEAREHARLEYHQGWKDAQDTSARIAQQGLDRASGCVGPAEIEDLAAGYRDTLETIAAAGVPGGEHPATQQLGSATVIYSVPLYVEADMDRHEVTRVVIGIDEISGPFGVTDEFDKELDDDEIRGRAEQVTETAWDWPAWEFGY